MKRTNRTPGEQRRIGNPAAQPGSPDHQEATRIAGNVAHELNNLLTVIQINTEFLLQSASESPQSAEEIEEIQVALRRASILTRQLLASSRLEPFDTKAAEVAMKRKVEARTGKQHSRGDPKGPRVKETILLVEDEAAVRTLTKRILGSRGYRVLEASDGAIALRLAAAHVGEIDLVLTDVEMPNLGGRGMVEELRELSPEMRVLFMSGFRKDEVFSDANTARRTPYLQKPFTGEQLAAQVRAALGYAD